MNRRFGAVILAGGKSERMVFPKAYLMYKGNTFLQNLVNEYRNAGVKDICVVMNSKFCGKDWDEYLRPIREYASVIENPMPEKGRMGSVKMGIRMFQDHEFCFIQNVDNPFINREVIECLSRNRNSWGYTSPVYKGRKGHPILVSRRLLHILNQLPEGDNNLRTILSGFPKRYTEVDFSGILANINTADDYERYVVKTETREKYLC